MEFDAYVRLAKHAGLNDTEALLGAVADLSGDPHEIADTLRTHHLIAFIRLRLPDDVLRARLSPELMDALTSRRPIGRLPPAAMLRAFDEVRRALDAAGVPVLLLKGAALATRLYGGLGLRPQHDVDVLVRPRQHRRALRTLARLGFVRHARDLHGVSVRRGDVQIDVHRHLRWAPAFALDADAVWSTAAEVRVDGIVVPTLSDEYTIVLLALAVFEDVGQGLARLKQLLDLLLALRAVDGATDWDAFLARRAAENIAGVMANVLALVIDLFDSRDELPRLARAIESRRALCVHTSRDEALALVAAPPKRPANLVWFGRVYPGSLVHYLLWFWYGGFPANLGRLGPAWLRSQLGVAAEVARRRPT